MSKTNSNNNSGKGSSNGSERGTYTEKGQITPTRNSPPPKKK